ncbi:helicase protein MOM1-like isoform X3 [Cornus florida]|uniref:helicase protein MOM1-like isoform X3 n=1 Tax=Cornus florida TaxID=4283 RepID=UPI0028A21F21|nr:helicase protein MOM1-like isoform X3 [Cornus florida]
MPRIRTMANDTRSSRNASKKGVSNSKASKKGVSNSKASSTSGSSTMDTSGLRRSAREASSSRKQTMMMPSPSKESVEKRTPVKKKNKSERFEKKSSPSPISLRRSERGKKKPSPSSSSGSKEQESEKESSGSPSDTEHNKNLSRKKSREVSRNQKQQQHQKKPAVGMKRKRMDARSYKATFKPQQRRGALQEGSGSKQVDEDGEGNVSRERREESVERSCEAVERSDSSLRNGETETLGNPDEVGLSYPEHGCAEEPHEPSDGDGLNGPSSDGIIEETLDDDTDLVTGDKVIASTRKRHTVDMDSNAFSMTTNKDICISVGDDVSSPSSACKRNNYVETCVTCSKRRRVGYDSPPQELCSCNLTLNNDLCDTSVTKDRGELESSIIPGLADKCDGNTNRESPLDSESDQNTCVICRLGGKLLCCDGKGCKRTYHISCLDPPLNDVPLGVWHCKWCVKKKIEYGVHSVSEGIESIWDTREVEVPDVEGLPRQKQYFVKYKGLAHFHNRWVPETLVHLEAPLLVEKFNRKNQVTRWKEWTMPHRLLKKRLLVFPVHHNGNCSGHAGDNSDPHYEWLVKWCGLDYEDATWELENASFLFSPHTQRLIREYEHRCEKAKRAALLSRVNESKKETSIKLPKLPAGVSPGIDNSHLNSVKKLLEYWQKGQHAVVVDGQERVMTLIIFILSLLPEVCLPFLIISPSSVLSQWVAGFLRLAPSIDVVIYSGDKDRRRRIRTLEFYEEGGSIMSEVLLSPPEAVVEDLDMLECIRWEAIIVDECQSSRISTHFEKIKMLTTDVRFLLLNGQIRDTIAEHLNLLSLLDSLGDLDSCDGSETNSNDNLAKLKQKLSDFVAYRCKSDSSRFVEYWLPVRISNVQLEQYCATLLSNSFSLRSKNASVGALRDILISMHKCCDHPYTVDPSLQGTITKGLPEVEYLDVGIKASGKLELLDAILSEIKNLQLRVVILFQSIGGSRRDSIGDILDDFLRQRFGPDSYERIEKDILQSRKQAALNKFNDKDSGRFVFLLENRACHGSIKLSSVDTIVIFDSDWNPANDLRALHKISIDSQFEQIKIFRLYSSCTVEEKLLIFPKPETLDNNLHSISRITSHTLLMWGASYLFNKLDEFHGGSTTASGTNVLSEQSVLQDVVKEFLALLSWNAEKNDISNSIISKVQQSGGGYSRSISLLGEVKNNLADGEEPHVFWTKLLEGRNPRWKYLSGPLQRNRKRVQYFVESPGKRGVETGEVGKKRKKVGNDIVDLASSVKPGLDKVEVATYKDGASGNPAVSQSSPSSTAHVTGTIYTNYASSSPFSSSNISLSPELNIVELEERRTERDAQKSLHLLLKPDISRLCEILQLPEDVKVMVRRFLEYVIDNHHVNREPATILQAFQISLCWIGASLLKYKIDRKQSLALAQHHLNFGCKEEEAKNVYSKLRLLKKMFLHHSENLKDSDSEAEDITKEPLNAQVSQSVASFIQDVKLEVGDGSQIQEVVDEQVFPQQEQAPIHKVAEKEISRSLKRVQKKCDKRMAKLLQKHDEELQEFNREWEERRVQLEERHRLEYALVRSIHTNHSVRISKLKTLDNEFAKKLEEHKSQKDIRLKDLKSNQLAEMNEESQKAAHWLDEVKSLAQVELLAGTSSERASISGFEQPNLGASSSDGHENIVFPKVSSSGGQIPVSSIQDQVLSSKMPAIAHNEVTGAADSTEMTTSAVEPSIENDRREESDIITNAIRNQNGTAGSFINGDSLSVELPLESNIENNRTGKSDVIQNATGTQNNAGGIITSDSVSVELSLVKSAPVRPVVTPFQGVQLPHALAIQDKGSQLPTFAEMQDGDGPGSGNKNVLHQAEVSSLHSVDIGPTVQINHEAPIIEPVEQQLSSPSSNLSLGHTDLPPFHGVEHQPHTEGHTAEAPQLVELSNQAVLYTGTNLALHPPVDATNLPPRFVQPDLSSTSRVDYQPISEGCNSFQSTGTPLQMVEHTTELPSPAFQQSGSSLGPHLPIDTSAGAFWANLPIHIAPQVPSRISTLPLYVDPLQNEFEWLQKEMENTMKVHEDTKSRLRSDCEKEIEAIVAQIHMKYDTKLQDAEAAYLLKRKELDSNRNKVFMHKILAEAFRSKCLDLRPSGTLGMQQAVPSSSMNQLHHQPSQFMSRPSIVTGSSSVCPPTTTLQSTAPSPRIRHPSAPLSSIPTGSSSVCPPTTTQQSTVPSPRIPHPSAPLSSIPTGSSSVCPPTTTQQSTAPSPRFHNPSATLSSIPNGSSSVCPPTTTQQSTAPSPHILHPSAPLSSIPNGSSSVCPPTTTQQSAAPLPHFHHLSAPLSSIPTRPLIISPITPPTGNRQVVSEIRAPAPHLQPFRHLTSASATNIPSLPRGILSNHVPNNLSTSSTAGPQPPPPPLPLPTYHSAPNNRPPHPETAGMEPAVAPNNRPPQPEIAGMVPALYNSSMSAQGLLVDVDNQAGAHPPNILPSLPSLGTNFDTLDLSEFETPGRVGVNTENVVCLSDDD